MDDDAEVLGTGTNVQYLDPSRPDTVGRILLQGALTLFGLSLGFFLVTRVVPGGPCAAYYGERFSLSAVQQATCVARFGLGQSAVTQYLTTIGGYLHGDFGFSDNGVPIWNTITNQFPSTAVLAGGAILLQILLATVAGVYAARHLGGRLDKIVLGGTEAVGWLPPVWIGWALTMVLVVGLHWLPAGREDIQLPIFWSGQWFAALPHHPGLLLRDQLRHLVIPLVAIVLPGAAVSAQLIRHAVVTALQHPAIRTARAAGVQPSGLLVRLTFLGLLGSAGPMLAALLGSASVVGYGVVAWRGDETLVWSAASLHDWGELITLLLLGTLAVFLVSLGARLLCLRLDDRHAVPRSSFVLDLWWIVPVPEHRSALPARRAALPLVVIGVIVLIIMAVIAAFAPLIAPAGNPTDPILLGPATMNEPPRLVLPGSASWSLLLGTDGTGKPVLNWLAYGARYSLVVAALGALGAVSLGALLGVLSTLSRPGGWIVAWLCRVLQIIPPLPLLAALFAFLGYPGSWLVVVALFVLVAWPAAAVTIYPRYVAALHDGPAVAAGALGVTLPAILVRHVLPSLLRPFLRLLVLTMASILLTQAMLDALLPPPGGNHASWGVAFGAGLSAVPANWWFPLALGLAVYLTALALGLIERGLASWRVRPLPHAARRPASVPPSPGWPLGADRLSARRVIPVPWQRRPPPGLESRR